MIRTLVRRPAPSFIFVITAAFMISAIGHIAPKVAPPVAKAAHNCACQEGLLGYNHGMYFDAQGTLDAGEQCLSLHVYFDAPTYGGGEDTVSDCTGYEGDYIQLTMEHYYPSTGVYQPALEVYSSNICSTLSGIDEYVP